MFRALFNFPLSAFSKRAMSFVYNSYIKSAGFYWSYQDTTPFIINNVEYQGIVVLSTYSNLFRVVQQNINSAFQHSITISDTQYLTVVAYNPNLPADIKALAGGKPFITSTRNQIYLNLTEAQSGPDVNLLNTLNVYISYNGQFITSSATNLTVGNGTPYAFDMVSPYNVVDETSGITALIGDVSAIGPGITTATLSNAAVIGQLLTGFTPSSGAITPGDSILTGLEKLAGNVSGITITYTTTPALYYLPFASVDSGASLLYSDGNLAYNTSSGGTLIARVFQGVATQINMNITSGSGYIPFATSSGGSNLNTDELLSYNAATQILTAGNVNAKLYYAANSTSGTFYIPFINGDTTGYYAPQIGSLSFNPGTGTLTATNINAAPYYTLVSNSASYYFNLITGSASANYTPYTAAGLSFNPSTSTLSTTNINAAPYYTATSSSGPYYFNLITGSASANYTPYTAAGLSFDANLNILTTTGINAALNYTANSTSSTFYLPFINGDTTGYYAPQISSAISFNPGTGTLTTTNINASPYYTATSSSGPYYFSLIHGNTNGNYLPYTAANLSYNPNSFTLSSRNIVPTNAGIYNLGTTSLYYNTVYTENISTSGNLSLNTVAGNIYLNCDPVSTVFLSSNLNGPAVTTSTIFLPWGDVNQAITWANNPGCGIDFTPGDSATQIYSNGSVSLAVGTGYILAYIDIVPVNSGLLNVGSPSRYFTAVYAGAFTVISDLSLKTNIQALETKLGMTCLNFINNLSPISYSFLENAKYTSFGFLAQDIITELSNNHITPNTGDQYVALGRDEDGVCVVDPMSLIALSVGSIKDLAAMVNLMQDKMAKMQNEMNLMRDELATLKK